MSQAGALILDWFRDPVDRGELIGCVFEDRGVDMADGQHCREEEKGQAPCGPMAPYPRSAAFQFRR